VNKKAAVAAAPQGADAIVPPVEVRNIPLPELLDGRWQGAWIRRRSEQVIVRVHQREAMDRKVMLLRRPAQEGHEDFAIGVVADDRAAIVASLDHVNADVGDEDSRSSGHRGASPTRARFVLELIAENIGVFDRPLRISHPAGRSAAAETATGSDGCLTPVRTPV
jgi:hypothetical protein